MSQFYMSSFLRNKNFVIWEKIGKVMLDSVLNGHDGIVYMAYLEWMIGFIAWQESLFGRVE